MSFDSFVVQNVPKVSLVIFVLDNDDADDHNNNNNNNNNKSAWVII